MLEWNIDWLRGHGVDELVVNLHHGRDHVVSHFGDGSAFGVRISYSVEEKLLGTAGAIRGAAHLLGIGPFLVVYADNLYSFDLRSLMREHACARPRRVATVALHWRDDASSSGLAIVDDAGRISAFREKAGGQVAGWVNAGVILCEHTLIPYIPESPPTDLGRDVLPAVIAEGSTVAGHFLDPAHPVHWIDTPADLVRARRALAAGP